MTDPAVEALTQRLDRMERRLRRWRVLGAIAWAVLAASVAFIVLVVFRVPAETEPRRTPSPTRRTWSRTR